MSMIDTSWFLNKLKANENKPEQSLLGVFEVLSDMQSQADFVENSEAENTLSARTELLAYLNQQAKKAGLQAPELFAQQIYHMANNALIQQQANPASNAIGHAKQVAAALIQVQRKPGWLQTTQHYLNVKAFQYGLAASVFVLLGAGVLLGYQAKHANAANQIVAITDAQAGTTQSANIDPNMASPGDTAEMYSAIEKMRDGRCRYIEALQLPTAQQGVYLQNVIAGQVSNKASDQKTARELMGKVDCDYTPMLMKNSRG